MSIGIRKALKLAEDHAIGILESTDDSAFWGEDFFDAHEEDWRIFAQAKAAVLKRIACAKRHNRERQSIDEIEQEIALLRSMVILLESEPSDETAPIYQRTINRLQETLTRLRQG